MRVRAFGEWSLNGRPCTAMSFVVCGIRHGKILRLIRSLRLNSVNGMSQDVVACRALPNYRIWLRFQDNAEGVVDLSHLVGSGVFAAWNDPAFFDQVRVDRDSGTVSWPGGIDLDPYVLHSQVTGSVLPGASSSSPTAGESAGIGDHSARR